MVSIWHIIFRGLLCNVLLLFKKKKKCVSYKKLKTLRAQAHIFPKRLIGLIRLGVNGYFLAFNGWAPDAIYPLSQQALCPPPLRLTPHTAQIPTSPEREREKKSHSHARKKKSTCETFWASRIKHTEWKLPVNGRFVACFSSLVPVFFFFPFLSLLINFILRRLFEVIACFNASCCCAKTWDLHLSAASPEGALRLEALSMDFTDGFPDWSVAAGNTRPLNLDLFHLNWGLKVSRAR